MNITSNKVRHFSTSTILPATQKKDTTDQRIELNPSDLWLLRDVNWYLINLWSQISRRITGHISSLPPINAEPRWLPKNTNFPIHLPFSSIDKLFVERHRIDPPLRNGYFGNSIEIAVATVKAGDLLEKGPKFGALLLKQAVETCNNVEIRRGWESWVQNPVLPSIFDLISPTNLSVLGSTRFDLYGTHFGWGPPLASRSGSNLKYEGKITTDPGPV
ncbi:BAHD acyltransferase DCR-like [Papaver somniferum]|uniref:BAHD acyltransferase DCR-like n=1 Tax=Papaver somniferum TaxID=3469 RepID=UPI000E6F627E|nr:BAHD acyltransferase DCR-like [Papaver somniferum]